MTKWFWFMLVGNAVGVVLNCRHVDASESVANLFGALVCTFAMGWMLGIEYMLMPYKNDECQDK